MTVLSLNRFICDRGGKVWEGELAEDMILPEGWTVVTIEYDGLDERKGYHLCDQCSLEHASWLSVPATEGEVEAGTSAPVEPVEPVT